MSVLHFFDSLLFNTTLNRTSTTRPNYVQTIGRTLLPLLIASAALLAIAACAAHAPGAQNVIPRLSAPDANRGTSRSLVLVRAELGTAGPGLSLYDALQRLRPDALGWSDKRRGLAGDGLPVVYLGGTVVGGIEALRGIPVARVRKVQILSGTAAARRYGTGHEAGAIVVTLASPLS